jgi:hypothetical protein
MAVRNHRHIRAASAVEALEERKTKAPRGLKTRLARVLKKKPARAADNGDLPRLPGKPHEMSQRDYLILLLHIAAELEHALMVEYLYAAYSLGGPGAEQHEGEVRRWRDVILTVAREEMGHLLTVQNLLLLIGGPVSFQRSDYPWSSPFYPFPFQLEPLSLQSLATFVYAEMPDPATMKDPRDKAVARDVRRMLQGEKATVGEIYDKIIALISDETKIPDSMFNPGTYAHQATFDEWGRSYRPGTHQPYAADVSDPPPHERKTSVIVEQMATRTEAIATLREVAGQGEAEHLKKNAKTEPSHFDRFADIFRSYERILKEDPRFNPSRPVPRNPYSGEAKFAPDDMTPITAKDSLAWAGLFNVRYRMLLTLLTYSYRVPRDEPDVAHKRRAPLLSRIFGEMYNLKAIAGVLVRMPLKEEGGPERAGPPFEMPYTLTLPLSESDFWQLQIDLLSAADDLMNSLLRARKNRQPADGTRYLKAMRSADRDARRWIEQVLEGINAGQRWRT